jgi:hypothetical protein
LAKHLDSARIFKKAYYNKKESADLYVVGTLAGFAAHTSINERARNAQAAGSAFGLIGAIASAAATSGMKSNYDYEIKYNAIVVYDKAGNSVYQIPEPVSSENREIGAVITQVNSV